LWDTEPQGWEIRIKAFDWPPPPTVAVRIRSDPRDGTPEQGCKKGRNISLRFATFGEGDNWIDVPQNVSGVAVLGF
jgi:hypothetical protein